MKRLIKSSILLTIFSLACVGNGCLRANILQRIFRPIKYKRNLLIQHAAESHETKDALFKDLYRIKLAEKASDAIVIANTDTWNERATQANGILDDITQTRNNILNLSKSLEQAKRNIIKLNGQIIEAAADPDYQRLNNKALVAAVTTGVSIGLLITFGPISLWSGTRAIFNIAYIPPAVLSALVTAGATAGATWGFITLKEIATKLRKNPTYQEMKRLHKDKVTMKIQISQAKKGIKKHKKAIKSLKKRYFKRTLKMLKLFKRKKVKKG